jgi:glycerol-3-phosphate O-acyltransferase
MEKDIKLGLLNSLVEAQRSIFQNGEDKKIIVIPLVLSYHFVLEARVLIDQHLERSGEEKYLKTRDEFQSVQKILKFAWKVFSESSDINLSFGAPMDVMGNEIDDNGNSIDERGHIAHIKDYFSGEDGVEANKQREAVYTRHLGKEIVEGFKKYNIVISSHIVAFAAFEMLKKLNEDMDIFGLISLPTDEFTFDKDLLINILDQLLRVLRSMYHNDEIVLSDSVANKDTEELLYLGIRNMGAYHVAQPLIVNKKGEIVSQSFKLLYYYHNRLDHYELDKSITWDSKLLERAYEIANI